MPDEDLVELKFRLYDGTDIGPFRYSPASTVAMLKERVVAEWPKDKKIAPKAANDVKLINAGKILENSKTVGQCRTPFGELSNTVITMHVVVQQTLAKAKSDVKVPGSEAFARSYHQNRSFQWPPNSLEGFNDNALCNVDRSYVGPAWSYRIK
ncbi:hypothetical protein RHGRI_022719 [Rhododendron griersonianum]|uniref:Ubiquitin-like domain-containing protein n=1 Tax=Rhododendron griersonianum TaxID=479676 RepID=A0AAV6J2P9_9ERIC|nr:hypothetical protein RHGRI_022719 [Rhododendron griersonianum]